MNPVQFAVRKPVTVLVGVILVVLFGTLAALRLPIQLTPTVDRPIVTVTTTWEGASPQEVESEIVEEQEEKLKAVQGLREMTSTAVEGRATIELEFRVGVDAARALLEVSDKLRQVPDYPENVDEPVVQAGETQGASAIAWFILARAPDSPLSPEDLPRLRTLVENDVKPRLERAEGIAAVGIFGGVEREVHVEVDPDRLAGRGLGLLDVRDAIRRRNLDVSAGDVERGKRAYTVRTAGRFESLAEIEDLVLARRDGKTVRLRDVGRALLSYKEEDSVVRALGQPAIAINATRQSGTNVISVMRSLQAAVESTNREILAPRGLRLFQVYDQTTYIFSAIDLVLQNLYVGGALAIAVLLLFLRDGRSTFVIAAAIPVSVIGAFLALAAMGRNLNVVSLAGLAFAVGMVVDNSIVVLESIVRHRDGGKSPLSAALDGTREVWGAVLASTLTTVAVFVPVIFVEEEAGQLFRDISIAISAGVLLSLFVSVLFIPMVASRLFARSRSAGAPVRRGPFARVFDRLSAFGRGFANGVVSAVAWIDARFARRLAIVLGLTGAAVAGAWILLPPMSYLPEGNQNLVIGFLIPPPGYGTGEYVRIAERIEERLRPYWKAREGGRLSPEERRPAWHSGKDPIPGIENFFYVAAGQFVFLGARSVETERVKPLEALLQHSASDVPGVQVFVNQRSLFERGISAGNTIDLEVSASDFEELRSAAIVLMARIFTEIGPARPEPSNFDLGAPEIRASLDEARAADLGLDVTGLGFVLRCLVDGAVVSDYRLEGRNVDVKLVASRRGDESLAARLDQVPLFTPAGAPVPLSAVASLVETSAPSQIRHIEERRAIRLGVTPPEGLDLSLALDRLNERVIEPLRAEGALPPDVSTRLSGTADKLVAARRALQSTFLLAVVITYLLLAALFEHFLYPLVILFSVPLAAVGGVAGLRIVHELTDQRMDVLTMLGFVILVGTVVNNAILIVHRALQALREEGLDVREALVSSVRTRVRPMFMTTLTTVLGMLPLVLFPGAGSELYRGLGSVVIGGLLASTVFTLLVVPALFGLFAGPWRRVRLEPAT